MIIPEECFTILTMPQNHMSCLCLSLHVIYKTPESICTGANMLFISMHTKKASFIYWHLHIQPYKSSRRRLGDTNPQVFVVGLSMRNVRNSIWGWRWRSWPNYSLPSCALATDTPPPTVVVILWSTINQTTRVIPASNWGTSKNK
jgi:hypothetical protein